jgi:hypothetical protein
MANAIAAVHLIAAAACRRHGYGASNQERHHKPEAHQNILHCNSPFLKF